MAKGKIKVRSDTGKVFFSRVVTDGPVQRAFSKKFGQPIGACVKAATEGKSHFKSEKLEILKGCMRSAGVGAKGSEGNKLGVFVANSYNRRKDDNRIGGGQSI